MRRMNDHLGKGAPSEIQDAIYEVRESLEHALMFIHAHVLDSADGRVSEGVDGSYLRDAKDSIVEALIDLSAVEALNAAPPQLRVVS